MFSGVQNIYKMKIRQMVLSMIEFDAILILYSASRIAKLFMDFPDSWPSTLSQSPSPKPCSKVRTHDDVFLLKQSTEMERKRYNSQTQNL